MNTVFQHKQEQQTKLIGYIVTGTFHLLLLALLWFSMLREQDPPLDAGGMELSMALGEMDMGGPSEVPVAEPEAVQAIPEPTPDEQQTVTQDVEEVQVTSNKVVENPKKTEVKKPIDKPIEKPRTADQRALFKKNTSATAQGGSGDGSIPGNEGNPNGIEGGSPDGNGIGDGLGGIGNGTGRGIGDGRDGYTLLGRSYVHRPKVTDNSSETGIVVVAITVDKNGKVIKAEAGVKGSTTLAPALLEKARQGALEARFSPRTDGTGEQYGEIKFNFKVIK